MRKRVQWIELDERTDTRSVYDESKGDVVAILGEGPLLGWGRATHTVMAYPIDKRDSLPRPAHTRLSEEQADSLPKFRTQKEFHES